MKRYLVFTTCDYAENGGLNDLYSEADTIQQALEPFYHEEESYNNSIAIKTPIITKFDMGYTEIDEVHILDTLTGEKYFVRGYKELVELRNKI